jgi:hypothetical protein
MTPILTYTLTQQCGPSRPFCRPCTNSFTVQSCGPTHCEVEPPSQICLSARGPEIGECGHCKDGVVPGAYLLFVTFYKSGGLDPVEIGPYTVVMGERSFIGVLAPELTGDCYAAMTFAPPTDTEVDFETHETVFVELDLTASGLHPNGVLHLGILTFQPHSIEENTEIDEGCNQELTSGLVGIGTLLGDYSQTSIRLVPFVIEE